MRACSEIARGYAGSLALPLGTEFCWVAVTFTFHQGVDECACVCVCGCVLMCARAKVVPACTCDVCRVPCECLSVLGWNRELVFLRVKSR